MLIRRQLARSTFLGAVCALCLLCVGCQRWQRATVHSEGSDAIEISGTALSQEKELTKWMWSIPIVSEPAELESRPKDTLTRFKKNSFLVIIASDPIVLPECDSPTQSPCGELLVQLGRQTNVRAWMVPPLPDDAVKKPSSDSRAASEIDLRHILTYGYLLKFTTPLSGEEFPSTTEGVVERLDRFAVPIEGTLPIERPTNWTTRARLGGCANDEPFQLVIDCSHGSRFDPQGLARGIGLLALLPVLALGTALGGPPP